MKVSSGNISMDFAGVGSVSQTSDVTFTQYVIESINI